MPLVMFDLDDTLVQRAPLARDWLERYVAAAGHTDEAATTLVERLVEADGGGFTDREEFARQAGEHLGSPFDLQAFRDEVNDAYELTPGLRQGLERARAEGWHLAVVTNGPVDGQARKVRAAGLADLVDAVVISGELGVHKPDPLLFRTAAERAGTTLEGGWMVGDNLDADIAGGHGVGVGTVWVRPRHDWLSFDWDGEPDVVVDDVLDGLDHVLRIGPSQPGGGNRSPA